MRSRRSLKWVILGVTLLAVAGFILPNVFNTPLSCGGGCGSCVIVPALRAYLGAQGTFRREDRYGKGELVYANPADGKGFVDLYRLGGPLEKESVDDLRLIDFAFARATTPETAKCGYRFVDIVADGKSGPYDFTKECGLCAVPATYGKTGIDTFIVNTEGTVYKKHNGGKPVTVFPDVEKDGWRPVD